MMDKIDIILWVIGVGFTFNFSLMGIVWIFLNSNFKEIRSELKEMREHDSRLDTRVAVIESKITDLNTNVTRIMWRDQIPVVRDVNEQ